MSTKSKAEHADLFELACDVDRLTRLLHASTRPKAKVVDHARVGPFGAMVLMTIADHEPLPILNLATLLARDKAQLTRVVQMMERNDLIQRKASEEDGRVSLIELTPIGGELVKEFRQLLADVLEDVCGELDKAEQDQFALIVKKILSAADAT